MINIIAIEEMILVEIQIPIKKGYRFPDCRILYPIIYTYLYLYIYIVISLKYYLY